MENFSEEQISFQQSLSVDPRKSRTANKDQKRKHVLPESQVLSIINNLFVNTKNFHPCSRKRVDTGGEYSISTNSDASSLNFAKVGNFTSRSKDTNPLIKSVTLGPRVGLDIVHLLKSALAGGISCAFSAFLMHPVDTVKTQVQASTTLSFLEIMSKIPEIGARGLYKGSIPAVVGQFARFIIALFSASQLSVLFISIIVMFGLLFSILQPWFTNKYI